MLAREVDVHGPARHDAAAVFGVLREAFGGCFVYAVGRGEATFIGATPELLLRRERAARQHRRARRLDRAQRRPRGR